jgi:hypothetical protein
MHIFKKKKNTQSIIKLSKQSINLTQYAMWIDFRNKNMFRNIRSMQDDDSLLRSFVTIKPAAEKILSDGTDVDGSTGTAKYRRRTINN